MSNKINHNLTWSFAGPWYWEFQQTVEPFGTIFSQTAFLAKYGFSSMGVGFKTLDSMSDADKDKLLAFINENNITFHPVAHPNLLNATSDETKAFTENWLLGIEKYKDYFKCQITTSGLHAGHRFDRVMPLEKKLEIFSKHLTPVAKACKNAGFPLAVENHGDYYCSDYVELCKMTPDLHIFLDTGNTYLLGEKPVDAFVAAAPYTIGTHFKDHYVQPNPSTLHFEIDGAPLGDGDVELQKCYDILMKKAPNPEALIMEVEMVTPNGMDPVKCLEQSIAFINTLKGE